MLAASLLSRQGAFYPQTAELTLPLPSSPLPHLDTTRTRVLRAACFELAPSLPPLPLPSPIFLFPFLLVSHHFSPPPIFLFSFLPKPVDPVDPINPVDRKVETGTRVPPPPKFVALRSKLVYKNSRKLNKTATATQLTHCLSTGY